MTGEESNQLKARIAELEGVIAQAIAKIEGGERGTGLRILKTGKATVPMSSTGVIAMDGAR